jgi:hypothetical protein
VAKFIKNSLTLEAQDEEAQDEEAQDEEAQDEEAVCFIFKQKIRNLHRVPPLIWILRNILYFL